MYICQIQLQFLTLRFTNALEETVIKTISSYGIEGNRLDVNTGVWVGKNKISAVGVTASRWITMHGCSLNIDCDMSNFSHIVPCGIKEPGHSVCNLKSLLQCHSHKEANISSIDSKLFADTTSLFIQALCEVFSTDLEEGSMDDLLNLSNIYNDLELPTLTI